MYPDRLQGRRERRSDVLSMVRVVGKQAQPLFVGTTLCWWSVAYKYRRNCGWDGKLAVGCAAPVNMYVTVLSNCFSWHRMIDSETLIDVQSVSLLQFSCTVSRCLAPCIEHVTCTTMQVRHDTVLVGNSS